MLQPSVLRNPYVFEDICNLILYSFGAFAGYVHIFSLFIVFVLVIKILVKHVTRMMSYIVLL